jgi:hypothetical protein
MKKRLLRIIAASIFCASSYGIFTSQTAYACACSCTVVCPNTCSYSCDCCDPGELGYISAKCCMEEARNVTPYCAN